jgi:hypothetical protein
VVRRHALDDVVWIRRLQENGEKSLVGASTFFCSDQSRIICGSLTCAEESDLIWPPRC